jgi:hypothetical protein
MVRGIPNLFLGKQSHLQYLSMKKNNIKVLSFLFQIWKFKKFKKQFLVFILVPGPSFAPLSAIEN